MPSHKSVKQNEPVVKNIRKRQPKNHKPSPTVIDKRSHIDAEQIERESRTAEDSTGLRNESRSNREQDDDFLSRIIGKNTGTTTKANWIVSVINEVRDGRKRVPSGWWERIRRYYNEKFRCKINLNSLKVLFEKNKRIKRSQELKNKINKRVKIEKMEDEIMCRDVKLYKNILAELKKNMKITMEDRILTKKIRQDSVDHKIIAYINHIITNKNMIEKLNSLENTELLFILLN